MSAQQPGSPGGDSGDGSYRAHAAEEQAKAASSGFRSIPWQRYPAPADDVAASFYANGFYVCKQPLFPQAALQAAVEGMDLLVGGGEDTSALVGPQAEPNASRWHHHAFDPHEIIKLENPQWASRGIRALLAEHGGALGALAARLTGANWVQIWHVQLLGKPDAADEGEGSLVGWHQDRHYHQGDWEDPSEIFTAWIALSDVKWWYFLDLSHSISLTPKSITIPGHGGVRAHALCGRLPRLGPAPLARGQQLLRPGAG